MGDLALYISKIFVFGVVVSVISLFKKKSKRRGGLEGGEYSTSKTREGARHIFIKKKFLFLLFKIFNISTYISKLMN